MSERSLDGVSVIVTGASSGVGRAAAQALLDRGASVAVLGRDQARLAPLASRANALALGCDVTVEADVERAVAAAVRRFGRLDALVNCAGADLPRPTSIRATTLGEWQSLFAVNATGTFLMSRSALPHLEAAAGAIVNVLSFASYRVREGSAAYSAAKHAALAVTRGLASEYENERVRVTAVVPGRIDTPVWDRKDAVPPAKERERMLHAEDVAEGIVWVLSRPASVHIAQIDIQPGWMIPVPQ